MVQINSKKWLKLSQLFKTAHVKLVNNNRALTHRATNKIDSESAGEAKVTQLSVIKTHIKNRRIDLLDEVICDFVTDHLYDIDNQESVFVNAIMALYEEVTAYRVSTCASA
jgi:hypothetical protein